MFAHRKRPLLAAAVGAGVLYTTNLLAPPEAAEPDPATTIAVYLRAVPSEAHQGILDGLSQNAPAYHFVAVRSRAKLFEHVGFIVVESAVDAVNYELEGPSGRKGDRRVREVPVSLFLSLTALIDWPSTWDPIQSVSADLDVPGDMRYSKFDYDSLERNGPNALTVVAREESKNWRLLSEEIRKKLTELPPFGPSEN
ncbi:MAG: hypothetical protein ACR2RV_21930 [Verrucomicrobiales bacterium]